MVGPCSGNDLSGVMMQHADKAYDSSFVEYYLFYKTTVSRRFSGLASIYIHTFVPLQPGEGRCLLPFQVSTAFSDITDDDRTQRR